MSSSWSIIFSSPSSIELSGIISPNIYHDVNWRILFSSHDAECVDHHWHRNVFLIKENHMFWLNIDDKRFSKSSHSGSNRIFFFSLSRPAPIERWPSAADPVDTTPGRRLRRCGHYHQGHHRNSVRLMTCSRMTWKLRVDGQSGQSRRKAS